MEGCRRRSSRCCVCLLLSVHGRRWGVQWGCSHGSHLSAAAATPQATRMRCWRCTGRPTASGSSPAAPTRRCALLDLLPPLGAPPARLLRQRRCCPGCPCILVWAAHAPCWAACAASSPPAAPAPPAHLPQVRVWDAVTGEQVKKMGEHKDIVNRCGSVRAPACQWWNFCSCSAVACWHVAQLQPGVRRSGMRAAARLLLAPPGSPRPCMV